ncbi:FimD/PapC N-terminal domain-containing protein [Escherichia coli]
MTEIIPQASVRYDVNDQRLDIDVPQARVMKNYQNYVDPSLWGKTALMRPCCHTTSTDIIVKPRSKK